VDSRTNTNTDSYLLPSSLFPRKLRKETPQNLCATSETYFRYLLKRQRAFSEAPSVTLPAEFDESIATPPWSIESCPSHVTSSVEYPNSILA
jgi:hypothetical protein